MLSRREFLALGAAAGAGAMFPLGVAPAPAYGSQQVPQVPLSPAKIPQFVDPLPTFVGARVPLGSEVTITMESQDPANSGLPLTQKVLPAAMYPVGVAGTRVWGYKIVQPDGTVYGPHYPAFTLEATRGVSTTVTYENNITDNYLYKLLTVDQTLHWADPLDLGHDMSVTCPVPPPGTGANPHCQYYTGPVPAVPHLHGGEVESASDGGPDNWWTAGKVYKGPGWEQGASDVFFYPNLQESGTLWFHDHGLGVTRLNVYAGLAGFYFLRDTWDTGVAGTGANLPAGPFEIEMAIQDRMFDANGQWFFPDLGLNPEHPYWVPEFLGDTIVVNGKTWPYLDVQPRRYRFRLLNGSNARTYELWSVDQVTGNPGPTIWQIGADDGLFGTAVPLTRLVLMPGERADVIIDFAGFGPGTNQTTKKKYSGTLLMRNTAKSPYPGGAQPAGATLGRVMQFRVASGAVADTSFDPALTPDAVRSPSSPIQLLSNGAGGLAAGVTADARRQLTLNEIMGMPAKPWAGGPLEILVNNTKWDGTMSPSIDTDDFPDGVTETPRVGSTEVWDIVNLTADAHPIHTHLVQFQLVYRWPFDVAGYNAAYAAAFPGGSFGGMTYAQGAFIPAFGPPMDYVSGTGNGVLGGNPSVTPFLTKGKMIAPAANERGWKDTIVMLPGQVTRIVVRWAPTDAAVGSTSAGTNPYPMITTDGVTRRFDSTTGPGYVWHCHIIDHEDNEMMRPQKVQP